MFQSWLSSGKLIDSTPLNQQQKAFLQAQIKEAENDRAYAATRYQHLSSEFKSANDRVWGDGSFAANLEKREIRKDYYAIHAISTSTYIPSRDPSNVMIGIPSTEEYPVILDSGLYTEIGKESYKNKNKISILPTSKGIATGTLNYLKGGSVNVGYIIKPSKETEKELNRVYEAKKAELMKQGVYNPNPKLHYTKEIDEIWKKETNNFLPGESTAISLGRYGGNIKLIRTTGGSWAIEIGAGSPDASISHGRTYEINKKDK